MAFKAFKLPNQVDLFPNVNKKFLITSGAIQALRSTAFNITLGDVEVEQAVGKSDYGTPVMDKLEFPEGSYIDLEGNQISFSGISIATVILEVSLSKNIIKTAVSGRNGTIKEFVADNDYSISGRGFISNKNNVIPLDSLRTFRQIMQVPNQIEVISQYLNEVFEINYLVIENFSMPQIEGFRNELPFSFQAISDIPLDINDLE